MAEDKNKKNEEQLKDEQLDQVAGGKGIASRKIE